MDELRFARVEQRIDELKEDMSEVKVETRLQGQKVDDLKDQFSKHTEVIEKHVLGDEKIITHIAPLVRVLPHLEEMVEDYKFNRIQKQKRADLFKSISVKIGVATGTITLLASFWKLLHVI
jgi:aspartate carbamoyltransferase catalytic subunit